MAKKTGTLKPTHEIKGSLRSEAGEAKGVRVYVGDCRDVLPEIPQVTRGSICVWMRCASTARSG